MIDVMTAEFEAVDEEEEKMAELVKSARSTRLASIVPEFKGALNQPDGDHD